MKLLNFDLKVVGEERLLKLNEIDEFCLDAYENTKFYKKCTKMWHDKCKHILIQRSHLQLALNKGVDTNHFGGM